MTELRVPKTFIFSSIILSILSCYAKGLAFNALETSVAEGLKRQAFFIPV